MSKRLILLGTLFTLPLFLTGCLSQIVSCPGCESDAKVTSSPLGAKVYFGKDADNLRYLGKTPYVESVLDVAALCYQAKKEGYVDSDIRCYGYNLGGRHVHFDLKKW